MKVASTVSDGRGEVVIFLLDPYLENGDAVDVIDTLTQQRGDRISVGYAPQALVYVPNAVPTGAGLDNHELPRPSKTMDEVSDASSFDSCLNPPQ